MAVLFVATALTGLGWLNPEHLAGLSIPVLLGVDRAAGMPDYEASTGTGNIPWIFSKKTVAKFYDKSVAPFTSNTDYEGEIKGLSSKVVITTIPSVTIKPYQKGMTIDWELLESDSVELDIDRAQYFAFKYDKVDIKQFAVKMMDKAANDAAEQMKIYTDTIYLANVYASASSDNKGTTAGAKSSLYNVGTTGSFIALTKANIVDYIMMCEAIGNEQSWPDTDRWMVLPTWAKLLLDTSELKDASLTGNPRSNLVTGGRFGQLGKFTLYESNLYTAVTDTHQCYNITFGHKSGVTFATQLVETEFHEKLETTFGSGMKGLQVYGFEVIKPESVGVLYAYKG
jgi:hypothetical protein